MRGTRQSRVKERFWSRVKKTDSCWNWIGGISPSGYGRFSIGLRGHFAHRKSYEINIGRIPNNLCILHKCDNRHCVRPDHLFLGTRLDNARDMVNKGRSIRGDSHYSRKNPWLLSRGDRHWSKLYPERLARGDNNGSKTHPERVPKGESSSASKLKTEQIIKIKNMYLSGQFTQSALEKIFNIDQTQISRIVRNLSWKHLL